MRTSGRRTASQAYGGQTLVEPLRRVLVRTPERTDLSRWREFGWLGEPDVALAARQHERLCEILRDGGAEVLFAQSDLPGDPDAVYTCDPAIMSDAGAIVLRPGKQERRVESAAMTAEMRSLGVPVAFEMQSPATAEGGDTMWLDEETLLVGRSYRTNEAGIAALRAAAPAVDVLAFDLPHRDGPSACLHLMSLLSPLDRDLIVAFVPLVPVRLMELLEERGIEIVQVPGEEFASMGPNVLALAPRVALALEGNPETRRRMERAGVQVHVYDGSDISHKGEGGPTCLTRAVLRRA
ncbi:MAG: arginine deiminase family protein [Actinobacteria bacterium]|nr:arginine deiminase family protein [Actinomycetota bacterium]